MTQLYMFLLFKMKSVVRYFSFSNVDDVMRNLAAAALDNNAVASMFFVAQLIVPWVDKFICCICLSDWQLHFL